MIGKLLGLIGIFKELPEAIGYSVFGPLSFSLPKEIRDIFGKSVSKEIETVKTVYICVDNFTNTDASEVSILYGGKFHYTPNVYFARRDIQPDYEHLIEEKSLLIKKLPPKESVHIEIFLDKEEVFFIDDVMVGERLITKWMNKITDIYRYPKQTFMLFSTCCIFLFAIAITGWSVNKVSSNKDNYRVITEAMAGWDGCRPKVFKYSI